jgi:hypothetical protein
MRIICLFVTFLKNENSVIGYCVYKHLYLSLKQYLKLKAMKKILIIIILSIGFVNFRCDNEQADPEKNGNDLTGRWKWINSCGGITGGCHTAASTGNRIVIEFTKDTIFRIFRNDKLTAETSYALKHGKSIFSTDSANLIDRKNMLLLSFSFATRDTLLLNEECYDCYGSKYVRIK